MLSEASFTGPSTSEPCPVLEPYPRKKEGAMIDARGDTMVNLFLFLLSNVACYFSLPPVARLLLSESDNTPIPAPTPTTALPNQQFTSLTHARSRCIDVYLALLSRK